MTIGFIGVDKSL